MNDSTDNALLRRWRDGDSAAGKQLFERHYSSVERFFHNKVSEPADLIQRTFLACVESPERYRGDSKFRTFLLGIAHRLVCNHFRDRIGPRNHASLESTSVEDMGQTPSEVLEGAEEERMLLTALRRLPLELQVVLELYYWERLTMSELAEVLDIPPGTVANRLRRSKQKVKVTLTELATSPQKLHSTLTRLDDWADQIRGKLSNAKSAARK
ncbi:MAG: sigma-70 family RNA polymerase sigma factor [Deltaproteobacteria bacterium]|nr:sigma-70 family RNA polymerase sigma factor [Deltaproteobacteria bacterium]